MTPLKEMYDRLAELKAKEKRYSEEESEISELQSLVALREKYLQRYINHPPYIVKRVDEALQPLVLSPKTQETFDKIRSIISGEVNSMMALGQIFGRADHDDLIYYIEKNVVVS